MSNILDTIPEETLKELNSFIEGYAYEGIGIERPKAPVLLIMGCPRSGTTLLYQYLASTGCFAYPSNLISRFYGSPKFGSMVQKLLISENFARDIKFESNLGKTEGIFQPSEYWYFWRRFFAVDVPVSINEEMLAKVDKKKFIYELAMLEDAFNLPLLMKGMLLCFNIEYLNEILKNVIFIYIKRAPIFNAQSLLNARLSYFNDINSWYSAKPPQYNDLITKDPYFQVAGQVFYTNKAIEKQLKKIKQSNYISIEYEEFCKSPYSVFKLIKDRYLKLGASISGDIRNDIAFESTNINALKENELNLLKKAFEEISDMECDYS